MRTPQKPKNVQVQSRLDLELLSEMRDLAEALGVDDAELIRRAVTLKVRGPDMPSGDLTLEEEAFLFAFRTLRLCSPELADAALRVVRALADALPMLPPPPAAAVEKAGRGSPKKGRRK